MKMTHSMNTAQALHVPMNTTRFTTGKAATGKAVLALSVSIAVLLSACSKPVTEATPPQTTITRSQPRPAISLPRVSTTPGRSSTRVPVLR